MSEVKSSMARVLEAHTDGGLFLPTQGTRLGRKAGLSGLDLPRWLRRAPQRARPRLNRVEQRPVAVREHVTLGERRAQLDPERAQHPVVAVIALQDDADERCGGAAAGAAELLRHRIAPGGIELGERLPCEPGQMVQ